MCVAVFFLALNPVTVGEPPSNTAYMPYNRYGYALIGLLMVEAVTEAKREEFQGGVSTGVTLAILLFLKITYFAGAMFLVAALAGCRRQTRERWLGILGGAGVVCLGFCWYLQFDLAAMWGDLRMASGAKPIEVNWWIVQNLRIPVASFLLLVSLSAAFLRSRAIALAGASMCVAGIFLLSTNFQFFDLPLNALMIILILNELSSEVPSQRSRALQRSGLLLFGMMFVFGCIAWDALGLGYGVANKRLWEQTAQARFDSARWRAFTLSSVSTSLP